MKAIIILLGVCSLSLAISGSHVEPTPDADTKLADDSTPTLTIKDCMVGRANFNQLKDDAR